MTLAFIALYTFSAGFCAGWRVGLAAPGLPFVTRWERTSFIVTEFLSSLLWPIWWGRGILRAMERRDG